MPSLLQAAWQPGSAEFTLWILHWTFLDSFSPCLHWWVSFFTKAVDSSTSRPSTALPSTCPTFKRTNTVLSTFYIYCFPCKSNWIIMLAFSLIHLWLCFLHTFSLSLYHRSALVGTEGPWVATFSLLSILCKDSSSVLAIWRYFLRERSPSLRNLSYN